MKEMTYEEMQEVGGGTNLSCVVTGVVLSTSVGLIAGGPIGVVAGMLYGIGYGMLAKC